MSISAWGIAKAVHKKSFSGNGAILWAVQIWAVSEAIGFVAARYHVDAIMVSPIRFLVIGLLTSTLAVHWHRRFMFDEELSYSILIPTPRALCYFLISIVILSIWYVPIIGVGVASIADFNLSLPTAGRELVGLVAIGTLFVSVFGYFYVVQRLALVFPLVACGIRRPVAEAWSISRGRAWKIFSVQVFTFWPWFIAASIASRLSVETMKSYHFSPALVVDANLITAFVLDLISSLFLVIAIGTGAGALTLSYRSLKDGLTSVKPDDKSLREPIGKVSAPDNGIGIAADIDDNVYAEIAMEIDGGHADKGMWTRLFAELDGDENKVKAAYIKERAKNIFRKLGDNARATHVEKIESALKAAGDEFDRQVNDLARKWNVSHGWASDAILHDIVRCGDGSFLYDGYQYDNIVDAIRYASKVGGESENLKKQRIREIAGKYGVDTSEVAKYIDGQRFGAD